MSTNNVDNLSDQEVSQITLYAKGLIEGIRDVLPKDKADFILEDYWYAWDNTIDMNIMYDPQHNNHVLCLYPVYNQVRDDSTFQRFILGTRG